MGVLHVEGTNDHFYWLYKHIFEISYIYAGVPKSAFNIKMGQKNRDSNGNTIVTRTQGDAIYLSGSIGGEQLETIHYKPIKINIKNGHKIQVPSHNI